jgi:hypothetical protein
MPSDIRSKTKPPGVTDPARATPAFFVGASFWDSSPDADPDARLYDRAPHPVQIGDSGPPGLMVDRRQIAGSRERSRPARHAFCATVNRRSVHRGQVVAASWTS